MEPWLLELMRCPVTGEPLHLASAELVAQLNRAVANESLRCRNGNAVTLPLDGALANQSSTLCYGIFEDVPNLIPDEAIALPVDDADGNRDDSSRRETFHDHAD